MKHVEKWCEKIILVLLCGAMIMVSGLVVLAISSSSSWIAYILYGTLLLGLVSATILLIIATIKTWREK